MMQWALFVVVTIVAYVGISLFAQLSGGSSTNAWQAFFSAVRPLPLAVMVVANMFYALGVYYGFLSTRFAIPITLVIGAITSFAYSALVLGAAITPIKVLGVILAIGGAILLGM